MLVLMLASGKLEAERSSQMHYEMQKIRHGACVTSCESFTEKLNWLLALLEVKFRCQQCLLGTIQLQSYCFPKSRSEALALSLVPDKTSPNFSTIVFFPESTCRKEDARPSLLDNSSLLSSAASKALDVLCKSTRHFSSSLA